MQRLTAVIRAVASMYLLLVVAAPAYAEIVHIDNAQLSKLIEQGVPVVDIRTAPEWTETGVVKGSHLLTFFDDQGRYDAAAWLEQVQRIAKPGQHIVVICRSGNRTLPVSRFLDRTVKYRTVYNVRAGIRAWIDARLPVEKPPLRSTPMWVR